MCSPSLSLNLTPLRRCRQPLRRAWRCVPDKIRLSGVLQNARSKTADALTPAVEQRRVKFSPEKKKKKQKNSKAANRGIKTLSLSPVQQLCFWRTSEHESSLLVSSGDSTQSTLLCRLCPASETRSAESDEESVEREKAHSPHLSSSTASRQTSPHSTPVSRFGRPPAFLSPSPLVASTATGASHPQHGRQRPQEEKGGQGSQGIEAKGRGEEKTPLG